MTVRRLYLFLAVSLLSPLTVEAACYHLDSSGRIHNTCDHPIKVFIERRYMMSQGMHSIEKSEITSRTIEPQGVWRPLGSGFEVIREEGASRRAVGGRANW